MSEAQEQGEEDLANVEDYARIVTNQQEMSDILSKIRLKGTDTDGQTVSLVEDTILKFEDGKVWTRAFDGMKSVWVEIDVQFDGIRNEGSLIIGDISYFLDWLSRFGDSTIVEHRTKEDSNELYTMFNDEERKEGGYPTDDESHIESVQQVNMLPYEYDPETDDTPSAPNSVYLDTWFECPVSEIVDVLEDGDTTEVRRYPFSVEDGHIQIRVGDDSSFIETDFQADEGEGTAASIYAYGIHNVFSNLSGEVTVYLTDDQAMWVHQETEEMTVDYMVAEEE